ncbi:MAG: uroporphyrinogen-III synthase [Ignavibacteriaceae bacterium]|nr:uroporphyrinogen-III synthase [Ignavibacteriaceae bacterium]
MTDTQNISIKKEKKREMILEAASLLFSQKNYHEVMMEEVAQQISVAKGTLYNYFKSKEDLYFSIMTLRMRKLVLSLEDKIKTETSSISSLRTFIIHLYMFMMKYQNFFLMYQKENLTGKSELCTQLIKLDKELKQMLEAIIIKGKEELLFRKIEDNFAVDVILGCIYGAVQRGIDNELKETLQSIEREKIFDFVLYGLVSCEQYKELLPLKGKTIVITRTVEQSDSSANVFRQLGANVIPFPTLDIVPPASWRIFDETIISSKKIDFLIFTSGHSVRMFISRCTELKLNFNFNSVKVVAVGSKTASVCSKLGVPVHIIPKEFSGEGVIAELIHHPLKQKIIFIPRSAIGREELPRGLEALGAVIKTAPVYNVAIPAAEKISSHIDELHRSTPDLIIFTSPSTFENYLQILNIAHPVEYFANVLVAAIGPTTKSAIEAKGIRVKIMPGEYTIDALAKTIVEFYRK